MIEVRNLKKRFGKVLAVDDVSFEAADGRITGLLGPNGAGKSTTLRMIAGVIKPHAGFARIDRLDVADNPKAAVASLGNLPFNSGLYPRLTGRENIAYFGKLHGLAGRTLEARVSELIETLGLREVADRPAKGYSQGETMKVAVARAQVGKPGNHISHAPPNGRDRESMRPLGELNSERRTQGHCILFSSHVMQEVAALCDRIVIISHGHVTADGTPDELRERFNQPDLEEVFMQAVGE
jgi:sodium transport system ATP-binding protein